MALSSKIVSSVFRNGLFNNKVALVTGGGTGIGKCIAQELLFLGCNVMIASRKAERLESSAKEIRTWLNETKNIAQLDFMTCNIRKEDEVQNLMAGTLDKFGKIDFVVNNGGGQFISCAEDISLKGWNAVIETNLTGTFLMCKEELTADQSRPQILMLNQPDDSSSDAYNQHMKDHGGAIVNIIADMWKGFPMMSHTGAARAAVDNLTKSLSLEWVANGVRVNSVAPRNRKEIIVGVNFVASTGTIYSDTAAANYGESNVFEMFKSQIPYHRLGTVEEVSSAVCFLLSPAARFINGETLRVDAAQSHYSSPMLKIPVHNNCPPYTWESDAKDQKKS